MALNEHKNLSDTNRHFPKGYEAADNNTFLGKASGVTEGDKSGGLIWAYALETFIFRDKLSPTAVASNIAYMRMPYKFRLTDVRASVKVAGDTSVTTVDIKEDGVSILSTLLTIDANEKTSTTAATPVVISDYALADDAEITIDITTISAGTAADGLQVYLIGYREK